MKNSSARDFHAVPLQHGKLEFSNMSKQEGAYLKLTNQRRNCAHLGKDIMYTSTTSPIPFQRIRPRFWKETFSCIFKMAESEDSDKVVDYYAILNVRKEVNFARSLE